MLQAYKVFNEKGIDKKLQFPRTHHVNSQFLNVLRSSRSVSFILCIKTIENDQPLSI